MYHCYHALLPLRRRLRFVFDLQSYDIEPPYTLLKQDSRSTNESAGKDLLVGTQSDPSTYKPITY
jgi:hypothetical protein